MQKYKSKLVEIEAAQWKGENNVDGIEFCLKHDMPHFLVEDGSLIIPTMEGKMRATKGDWIIKGLMGEYYPCHPNVFEQKYEL